MTGKSMVLIALLLVCAGAVAGVRYLAHAQERATEAAFPPEGAFVDVGGVPVHYVQAGAGPDVILLHGAGGSTRDFTFAFAERLTDRYRVTIFDRPGLGYTGRIEEYGVFSRDAETPREQARFLQAAADQLGVTEPVVLGHSFGGAVAMAWALERSEETAGLVMVGGVSNAWEGGLGWFYNVTAHPVVAPIFNPLATALVPDSYVDGTVAGIFRPQDAPDGYAAYIGPRLSARRGTLYANGRQVHGLKPHIIDMVPGYATLPMPIEIVHGDADDIVPLHVHSIPLSGQAPGAVLTVLEGVGHMPQHSAPAEVEAAIDRAVERAGLTAGLR
ncbi:MAG: alpha/beta hydrolase [Pseudomonadota bacterium]